MIANGRTSRRGYGHLHQQERLRVKRLVDAGVAKCSRCGGRITPQQKWHLDHEDHPLAHQLNLWRGPSHESCNIKARRGTIERQPPAAALAFFHPAKTVARQQITEDQTLPTGLGTF